MAIDYQGLFVDICEGISAVPRKSFFIKHLTLKELSEIERFKQARLDDLISKGAKTEKEILEILNKRGIWTEKNEASLKQKQQEYKGISESLPKIRNDKQKKQIQARLDELKIECSNLIKSKNQYMGVTAESSAEYLADEYRKHCTIVDANGKRVVSWDEWEEAENEELREYNFAYIIHCNLFTEYNIGNIAVQRFFKDIYDQYPEDATYLLWQRPAKDLTEYQIILSKLAKFVRQYLQTVKGLSEDIKGDIYKLIDHNNAGNKAVQPNSVSDASTEAKKLAKAGDGQSFNMVKDYKKMKI